MRGDESGSPKLDLNRLDDGPQVTVTLSRAGGRTEMTVHVELPAHFSRTQVEEWLDMGGVREGWRDTIDRVAVALTPSSAAS